MSKTISRLVSLPTSKAASSSILLHQQNIEQLENKQRAEALEIIWKYDPENETEFPFLMDAFVRCVGTKAKAGRMLLVPPVTMHRWLTGAQLPRIFLRASFKARMIELLSEADNTSPTGTDNVAATSDGVLKRRRVG